MLDLLFQSPLSFLVFILSLVIAISIHEFAHAWAAEQLGDPTPRLAGRLTLDPRAHLDPLGTLSLLIIHFGWGKPVPIDPYNLANPRRDSALISLAGPGGNLILASLLSLVLRIPLLSYYLNFLISLLVPFIILNVSLAIFNLLPIPPLDGAKILTGFLPPEWGVKLEESLNRYGVILLILLIFPFFGGASPILNIVSSIVDAILRFLLPFNAV